MTRALGWIGLFLLLSSVAYCDAGSGDFCDAVCACSGCSSHDFDHCEIYYDADAEHADLHGCEDYWADYVNCVADGRGCRDRDPDFYCDVERDRYNHCVE